MSFRLLEQLFEYDDRLKKNKIFDIGNNTLHYLKIFIIMDETANNNVKLIFAVNRSTNRFGWSYLGNKNYAQLEILRTLKCYYEL